MIVDGNHLVVNKNLFYSKTKLIFFRLLVAPTITIDNDENENDAWTECRDLFEPNRSHMLNPLSLNNKNYLLRHSSANTSLNESSSLDALAGNVCTSIDGNHDDIFSIIEQAGVTFGNNIFFIFKKKSNSFSRRINWIIIS
jgi:hypothetical protein